MYTADYNDNYGYIKWKCVFNLMWKQDNVI